MELIVRKIAIGEELSFRDKVYTLDPDTDLFVPNIPEDLRKFKKGLREIIFLTGNKNKLTELKTSLSLNGDIKLVCPNEKINLAEIQDAEILNIVHDKCRRACEHLNEERACESDSNHDGDSGQVILVEDTCLNFGALNGMPGPYVKCESSANSASCFSLITLSCPFIYWMGGSGRRVPVQHCRDHESIGYPLFSTPTCR